MRKEGQKINMTKQNILQIDLFFPFQ